MCVFVQVGIDMHCFPTFKTDLELIERLVTEESVFCLPGQCFDYPNYMRIVLTVPFDLTEEACNRIAAFCSRYYVACELHSVAAPIVKNGSHTTVDSLENGYCVKST